MANFITIFRVFLMFIAVYLIIALPQSVAAYVWALILTILAFALDGVDGWVARKFHEESKLGALLDIMSDRIVENTYWILFAVQGWLSILFPLIAITRGFITDTIRSAISYAVAKVVAFIVIVASKIPGLSHADIVFEVGYWLAVIAIVFCVVRGLPVVIEAKAVLSEGKGSM